MAGTMISIQDLITSSARVYTKYTRGNWSMSNAMGKDFGAIYYNNKVAFYDKNTGIIEIRMVMGAKTEPKSSYHVVRMALWGVKGKVYNSIEELYREKFGKLDMRKKSSKEKLAKMEGSISDITNLKDSVTVEGEGTLNGFIVPVASMEGNSFGSKFSEADKFFYSEDRINLDTPVRVSCSCSDYYYTFSWYNYQTGVHLGSKPIPYEKFVGKGRGKRIEVIRNKGRDIGMCKHLMMFITLLLNGEILAPIGSMGIADDVRQAMQKLNNHIGDSRNGVKLATEAELNRMAKVIDSDLKKRKKERIGDNVYTDMDTEIAKRDVRRRNYKNKAPIQRGTSTNEMENRGIQRWYATNSKYKDIQENYKKAFNNTSMSPSQFIKNKDNLIRRLVKKYNIDMLEATAQVETSIDAYYSKYGKLPDIR